jgi:hypothetical protein
MVPVMGDGNGEREAIRCSCFRREEEEEARRLHGVEGRRYSEEQCSGRGGRRR